MARDIVDFRVDDVVRLRKPHPCGGFEWRIYRIGADIGLECATCARRVMLTRTVAEKRMREFVSRGRRTAGDVVLDGAVGSGDGDR